MKSTRLGVTIVAVFCLSGCPEHSRFTEKRGPLDEGLYYYETDLHGRKHLISEPNVPRKVAKVDVKETQSAPVSPPAQGKTDSPGRKKPNGEPNVPGTTAEVNRAGPLPTRVPHPALVDRDSTIHILVSPDRMVATSRDNLRAEHLKKLLDRKKAIQDVLDRLQALIEARKKAVALYQANDRNAFRSARREYGTLTRQFNASLWKLWPKNTPEYEELNDAFDKPTYFEKLGAFLVAEIREVEEEDRQLALAAKKRKDAGLSLQLFLDSPGKERVPIHLEGYDRIDQLQLQKHDRFGLNLSTAEREELTAQMQATQALAAAANKVQAGKLSLEEALGEAVRLVCPRLETVLPDIKTLSERLQPQSLEKRFDRTRKLLEQFVARVQKEPKKLADQLGQDLSKLPETFQKTFGQEARGYQDGISRVMTLCGKWKAPSQADIPRLIDEALQLYSQLGQLSWAKAVQDTNDPVEWFARQAFKTAETNVRTALQNVLQSPDANELRDDLNTYYRDFRTAAGIVSKVQGILEITEITQKKPSDVNIPEPAALIIPLGEAKNTFVDLNYTPRTVGDTLALRATLYEGNDANAVQKDQTTASFKVDEFGYFARLSCAVVLVRPSELAGGNDQFRFAPTLSWMHHYVPRAEEDGGFASFLRTFRPSLGIHAAFLSFDTGESSDAIQIGLGGTLAFWEDRLQLGAGYNLMADSDDDGRYYFFVGTDLIGLLQTVGLTGKRGEVRPKAAP